MDSKDFNMCIFYLAGGLAHRKTFNLLNNKEIYAIVKINPL
jgi:hypothetical protein